MEHVHQVFFGKCSNCATRQTRIIRKDIWTYLGIPRVGVKYITEELARDGDPGDDQPVDVVRVDNKGPPSRLCCYPCHPVEVYEEGEKYLIRCGTVFEDAEKVCFEGDCGDVSSMEGQ